MAHQASSLVSRPREGGGTVLGIVSGKGGVGKSTLAANLALACAARGAKTLLVDGDVGLANADLLLGVAPRFDLSDWCSNRVGLEEVVCRLPGGLELLVSGSGLPSTRALMASLSRGGSGEIPSFVRSRPLSIFDLGAGVGSTVVDLAAACDLVWLVVTPEPTSLADGYTMARRIWRTHPRAQIEVVVNRALEPEAGERTYQSLQRLIRRFIGREVALRGILAEDPAMLQAVARQEPVVESFPNARIARQLNGLAETLLESAGIALGDAEEARLSRTFVPA